MVQEKAFDLMTRMQDRSFWDDVTKISGMLEATDVIKAHAEEMKFVKARRVYVIVP